MRSFWLFIIVAIFGAIVVLAAAIVLTSPVLIPDTGKSTPDGTVKYMPGDPHLPPPQYYTGIDFDSLKSDSNLTLIPLKSYRQQVTNYSCGAVAAMTVMSYYGRPVNNTDADEDRVAHEIYGDVSEKTGLNPEQITQWFRHHGWNATWGTGGNRDMLGENLKNGVPTMVEWMDWGGHWVVVTGYDTRGTETVWDDVIIFADSVDCHDDRADGVTYFNYGEFDAMWYDAHYFPENMKDRVWVVAVPGPAPLPA
jgi:hypothetical protein